MRLELNFIVQERELPIDYRRLFISFFKNSLKKYNSDLYEILYGIGEKKSFTFAPFFTPDKFLKDKIILKDIRVKIVLSTEDDLLGLHLFNAFLESLNKPYTFQNNNEIILNRVIKRKEKKIEEEEIVVKILSPLIIREKIDEKNSWYHLLDDKGIRILKRNLLESLKDRYPQRYIDEIEIDPIEIKKTVITFYGIKIQGTLGVLRLKGKKQILNTLYKSGFLSSRKSMGFGLLEVLE